MMWNKLHQKTTKVNLDPVSFKKKKILPLSVSDAGTLPFMILDGIDLTDIDISIFRATTACIFWLLFYSWGFFGTVYMKMRSL